MRLRFLPVLLLALPLLLGCRTIRLDRGTTVIHPPPPTPTIPSLETFQVCMVEVFSRRIAEELIADLHEEVQRNGAADLQVRHDDHFHHYFVGYLPGPRVLVAGEVEKDGSVTQLHAWRMDDLQPVRVEPPPGESPPPPRAPDEDALMSCETCGSRVIKAGDRFCTVCGQPLR